MNEAVGNTTAVLGGTLTGLLGFLVIGFVMLVLLTPAFLSRRRRARPKSHGLEEFSPSLNEPDPGPDDVLPRVPKRKQRKDRPAPTTP